MRESVQRSLSLHVPASVCFTSHSRQAFADPSTMVCSLFFYCNALHTNRIWPVWFCNVYFVGRTWNLSCEKSLHELLGSPRQRSTEVLARACVMRSEDLLHRIQRVQNIRKTYIYQKQRAAWYCKTNDRKMKNKCLGRFENRKVCRKCLHRQERYTWRQRFDHC